MSPNRCSSCIYRLYRLHYHTLRKSKSVIKLSCSSCRAGVTVTVTETMIAESESKPKCTSPTTAKVSCTAPATSTNVDHRLKRPESALAKLAVENRKLRQLLEPAPSQKARAACAAPDMSSPAAPVSFIGFPHSFINGMNSADEIRTNTKNLIYINAAL